MNIIINIITINLAEIIFVVSLTSAAYLLAIVLRRHRSFILMCQLVNNLLAVLFYFIVYNFIILHVYDCSKMRFIVQRCCHTTKIDNFDHN